MSRINHKLPLSGTLYVLHDVACAPMLIAKLPLKECVKLPGIKDGTLFHKNARARRGSKIVIDKSIRSAILDDKRADFFFHSNGITAYCSKMHLKDEILSLSDLCVVSGHQLLNTIFSCREPINKVDDAFIPFHILEISNRNHRDQIATCMSWPDPVVNARDLRSLQSAVKASDMRRRGAERLERTK